MEAVIEGGFYQKGTDDDFDDQALDAGLTASTQFRSKRKEPLCLPFQPNQLITHPLSGSGCRFFNTTAVTIQGMNTMNIRLITEQEIALRQQDVRNGAYRARQGFSIIGIRRLVGNTFIAMGMLLHGTGKRHHTATDTSPQAIASLSA